MANRRLLDSSSTISHQYNYVNTLFLTLAFASCLISINCASFGRQLTEQSWQDQPEYQILTSQEQQQQDESDLDDLFGQISSPFRLDKLKQQQLANANGRFGLPADGRIKFLSSGSNQKTEPLVVELPSQDDSAHYDYRQPIGGQLVIEQLQNEQLESEQPSDYELSSPSNALPSPTTIVNEDNFYQKLKKLYSLLSQKSANSFASSDDPQSTVADKKNDLTYLTSSSQSQSQPSLATALDRAQEEISASNSFSFSPSEQQVKQAGADKDIYQLAQAAPGGESNNNNKEATPVGVDKSSLTTTLLEDDFNEQQAEDAGRKSAATDSRAAQAVIGGEPSSSAIHSHFGEQRQQESWGSMFKRMYSSLVSYLPSLDTFWGPSGAARSQPAAQTSSSASLTKSANTVSGAGAAHRHETEEDSPSTQSGLSSGGEQAKSSSSREGDGNKSQAPTKQSVSRPFGAEESSKQNGTGKEQQQTGDTKGTELNKTSEFDNSLVKSPSFDKKSSSETDGDNNLDVGLIGAAGGNKGALKVSSFLGNSDPSLSSGDSQSADDVDDDGGGDEQPQLLVSRTAATLVPIQGESLVGRYIYAPAQHYHLNAGDLIKGADSVGGGNGNKADEQEVEASSQTAQRSYAPLSPMPHRFHPGEQVYNSYSARPLYLSAAQSAHRDSRLHDGYHDGGASLLANKTNDLYFLVMVGAFCVMAMAVVLAAGLFAYRVQQSRKLSSDADYPTYGVVGPNNASNAKNGGGYFGGPGSVIGPSLGSGKCGSVKQLADLYNLGSDSSGLGKSGKRSATGSTSSTLAASDQQQQHLQSPNGNNNNNSNGNNFIVANQNAARMYHYQHQKQQMISSDRGPNSGRQTSASDLDSEDENDEGGYTVYECPGLASAHEMEIKNPLFNDDGAP